MAEARVTVSRKLSLHMHESLLLLFLVHLDQPIRLKDHMQGGFFQFSLLTHILIITGNTLTDMQTCALSIFYVSPCSNKLTTKIIHHMSYKCHLLNKTFCIHCFCNHKRNPAQLLVL
jgi:hypothetical protein